MLMSLFSVFDPSLYKSSVVTWFVCGLFFCFISIGVSVLSNRLVSLQEILSYEFFHVKFGKGPENMFLVCVFFFIMCVNFLGLLPFVFSVSSHAVFSLSLALPVWFLSLFVGFKGVLAFMSRFVLPGVPLALSWFLVLVEIFGNLIRPIALFIRLSVNMTVGHILLVLLGDISVLSLSLICGVVIFFLETVVCLVQSYVYVKLLTLYCMESYEGH